MGMASSESDWAWLPKNLLDSILDKLVPISDHVRFSAVCKPWLFVAQDHNQHHIRTKTPRLHQLPMLLIPTKDKSFERRSLYSITAGKTLKSQLQVPYSKRCCGSSHGWLATVEKTMAITLLNPFSGGIISLPPVSQIPPNVRFTKRNRFKYDFDVPKVVLSADPSLFPYDYVVVAIYGEYNRLAFIKSGERSWTYVHQDRTLFSDIIYY